MYLPLINRAGGIVWENIDRGRKYRPNAVRSVHTSEVMGGYARLLMSANIQGRVGRSKPV